MPWMIWHGITQGSIFPLSNSSMITVKIFPIFIAAVFRETYSFIKIMQPISPNYNWENGVKQIKITEENLSQSCILCRLLMVKMQTFFFILPLFALYLLSGWIYLTCLVFLKSPWWLVWIFSAPISLT